MINQKLFSFLTQLAKHNNRDWFHEHKHDYVETRKMVVDFSIEMEQRLNRTDAIELTKLFRINRDVRFSSDKSPYKINMSGYFKRLGAERRGSYYFSIEPGNTVVGGGFYDPNKDDLYRIRKELEMDNRIESIVSDPLFKRYFGTLLGNAVATAPRHFDKHHPHIHWIRKKQFYAFRTFSDDEVMHSSFPDEVQKTYHALRPFFNYMSEVLTTDLNGESIL
jgi:uncharacterized protein (TIGR02453 family)